MPSPIFVVFGPDELKNNLVPGVGIGNGFIILLRFLSVLLFNGMAFKISNIIQSVFESV